jgi:hypothetical protein
MAWFYGLGNSKKYHRIIGKKTKCGLDAKGDYLFKNSPTKAERCTKCR